MGGCFTSLPRTNITDPETNPSPFRIIKNSNKFPVYTVTGNHYEIGYQVGKLASERMRKTINSFEDKDMQKMRDFIVTSTGQLYFDQLIISNQKYYPDYFEEIRGLSEGSGVNYVDLLILSLKHELRSLINNKNHRNTTHTTSEQVRSRSVSLNAQETDNNLDNIIVRDNVVVAENDDDNLDLECADVLVYNMNDDPNAFCGILHNEDGIMIMNDTGFYVNATYTNTNNSNLIQHFGWQYPCSVFGHAFCVNNYGIVVTMNSVFPKYVVTEHSRGVYFIARSLVDCKNMDQVETIIKEMTGKPNHDDNKNDDDNNNKNVVSAYGSSINIGYRNFNDPKSDILLMNVELSNYKYDILKLDNKTPYYCHFNDYLRLKDHPFIIDKSSIYRLERSNELIKETNGINTLNDAINVLGDRKHDMFPIFRDCKPPDYLATVAIAIFDMKEGVLHVYESCNPAESDITFSVKFSK